MNETTNIAKIFFQICSHLSSKYMPIFGHSVSTCQFQISYFVEWNLLQTKICGQLFNFTLSTQQLLTFFLSAFAPFAPLPPFAPGIGVCLPIFDGPFLPFLPFLPSFSWSFITYNNMSNFFRKTGIQLKAKISSCLIE